MRRKTILIGVLAIAALGVATLGAPIWDTVFPRAGDADGTQELLAKMATQADRIDRLQAARVASDREIARLHQKLDILINSAGAPLGVSSDVGAAPRAAEGEEAVPETPLDAAEAPSLDWVDPVADAYDHEWNQSDWGKAAADAIDAAIPKHPFFSRYGGDFVTDCKMTTCRVEWFLPNTDQLSAGEREELLAMARYEMLGLAAANASDVGQLSTEWALEGSSPRIETTFKRADPSQ
ncbi:MAG: hypothetical protein ACK2UO_12355 [Caldilineaceae bacterium]